MKECTLDYSGNIVQHDCYYAVNFWRFIPSPKRLIPYKTFVCARAHVVSNDLRFYVPLRPEEGIGENCYRVGERVIFTVRPLSEEQVERFMCEMEQ